MLRSMTGFGKGSAENKFANIGIEIKSLNYKFFEVVTKLPGNLAFFEDKIRESIQKKIPRGRLNLFLNYDRKGKKEDSVYIDKKIAKQYCNRTNDLKRSLHLNGAIGIEQIISLPGVLSYRPQEEDVKKLWPLINKALSVATEDLIRSKEREGKLVKKNIRNIITDVEKSLIKIKKRAPKVVKDYKRRLLKNVRDLTDSKRKLNLGRMEEEAAIFARSSDISEETHRIASHILNFKRILSNHGEAGRRLDFMAQEMYREVNTTGAKANDFPISREVIKIKSLIEKIREQVQNVE
ncbi:MAG: YicC family protein [Candidatus Omnitrophica bacterium]|nr:YicC family protein [Candidatus Omnitrophota bacterium]